MATEVRMTARILALIFIYVSTCVAWMILGGSVWQRTEDASANLRKNVASIWGRPQTQLAPTAHYTRTVDAPHQRDGNTEEATHRPQVETVSLPLEHSRVNTDLTLEHRRKGLVWYSTYGVDFRGAYRFENTSSEPQEVTIQFELPDGQALYDGFIARVNGEEVENNVANSKLTIQRQVPAGGSVEFSAGYRSQGLDSWTYSFGKGASRVNDFLLVMTTNFDKIDFPDSGLSPGARRKTESGWELRWEYASLLSGLNVAMVMPAKLQPGELVSRITFFAPVSLMFFFFLMFILTLLKNIEIHPMNYFFLAASFFAFHLLLAYTADLIDIHLAFLISSAVSIFLVVSYLRLVVGMRFALREAGLLQFLYLVGFSYTFFLEGYSALCVTIASIVTLYIVMQLTGRIQWGDLFANKQRSISPASEHTRGGVFPG
jgi:inner membrane protein involved in colicin E2 resistance